VSLSKLPIILFLVLSLVSASGCVPVAYHQGKTVGAPRMEQERFLTADGVVLPVRTWQPRDEKVRAVIVALHGFNDYSNFFDSAGNFLSRRGVACYAYDQRGFGNTPRRGYWYDEETYTGDVTSFIDLVREKHAGVPVYLLGESMGGAISIAAVTRGASPTVDGVILVAPAVWGWDTMPWYQRWLLAIAAHTVPWLELTGDGLNVWPSDNKEMLRKFAKDPLVIKGTRVDAVYGLTNLMDDALSQAGKLQKPALVQYGAKDQIIPREPVLLLLEKMPKTTRKAFYRDGYHMLLRDLHGENALEDISAWIADHNMPLPHGAETLGPAESSQQAKR
jgi:acylglycerol lipase